MKGTCIQQQEAIYATPIDNAIKKQHVAKYVQASILLGEEEGRICREVMIIMVPLYQGILALSAGQYSTVGLFNKISSEKLPEWALID